LIKHTHTNAAWETYRKRGRDLPDLHKPNPYRPGKQEKSGKEPGITGPRERSALRAHLAL